MLGDPQANYLLCCKDMVEVHKIAKGFAEKNEKESNTFENITHENMTMNQTTT